MLMRKYQRLLSELIDKVKQSKFLRPRLTTSVKIELFF